MKKQLAAVGLGMATLVGLARVAHVDAEAPSAAQVNAQQASATQGPIVAQVGTINVTMDQLERPLVEAYGLNVLLNVVQLQIAKDQAGRSGVKVTPEDITAERQQTIERMFKESNDKLTEKLNAAKEQGKNEEAEKLAADIKKDNAQAFEQFLQNQHITKAEFDLVTETNAYLRKIAEPLLAGKISDDNLQTAFKSLYGETVRVRHIQCSNLQEIATVQKRLADHDPFEKVAMELSRNPSTAPLGGALPPFSAQYQNLPQEFRDAAFALKVGEVSEIVQAQGSYHLIKLEERIPPKAVKFEDVKESLRAMLQDSAIQATVKQLRGQLADQARSSLVINDPVLKQQWQERLDKAQTAIKDNDAVRKQLKTERERSATQPASEPSLTTPPPAAPTDLAPTVQPAAPAAPAAPAK